MNRRNDRPHEPLKGTYLMVIAFGRGRTIPVGRLGQVRFKKGHYVYVGSAFGPGGLGARIRHHLSVKVRRHWHLDYLAQPVRDIWVSGPGERLEHTWAGLLARTASGRICGFGCSDCACDTHLLYFKTLKDWQTALAGLAAQYPVTRWKA